MTTCSAQRWCAPTPWLGMPTTSSSSSPALYGERAAFTTAGQLHTAREAAAQASMLADALDTARLPDSHVQEDTDCVNAERGFRP
jgi:hypothetical protein